MTMTNDQLENEISMLKTQMTQQAQINASQANTISSQNLAISNLTNTTQSLQTRVTQLESQ